MFQNSIKKILEKKDLKFEYIEEKLKEIEESLQYVPVQIKIKICSEIK